MTIKQHKIIKGKLEGKTSKQIAAEVYPGTKTGDTMVRHELQKDTIQAALHAEMAKQGITLEKIVAPITKAIEAKTRHKVGEVITETDENGNATQKEYIYEEEDNIPLQLQGSDRASKWLGIDKAMETDTKDNISPEDIKRLAETSDTVAITQILFSRGQG